MLQLLDGPNEEEPPGRDRALDSLAVTLTPRPSTPTFQAPGVMPARRPRPAEPFPCAPATQAFRQRFYPQIDDAQWNDWRWQTRSRLRSLADMERVFTLSDAERSAIVHQRDSLPLGITPYYASLMGLDDPDEALRRTHVPVMGEFLRTPGEADDPLGEDHDTVVPGLVHRYPDRVLFLATGFCSTYCRYCTRSRVVGNSEGEYPLGRGEWQEAFAYIAAHPEIRDVLISGGDPLAMDDARLDHLLGSLAAIPHVEFMRLGTKVPMVMPMRVTAALIAVLRRHRPVWMSIHVTHPRELTEESTEALERLADAGVPLGSQTVLLKGINDSIEVIRPLMHGLLRRRVKPYYLYQCDPISGSAHFRTDVARGLEIIAGLRGHTSGYAVPHFVIDAPDGGGKVPLLPDYVVGRDGDDLLLRNFEGGIYRYPDPGGRTGADLVPPAVVTQP